MELNIQFVNVATSNSLEQFITDKLNNLLEKYDNVIKAFVYIKKENTHNEGGKICEIELSQPGPRIFASSDSTNYELAVKNTIKDLEKQLRKKKELMKPYI